MERARSLPADTVGTSVGTLNRYLDQFSALVGAARAEGLEGDTKLNPGLLRRKEKTRQRDRQRTFTVKELRTLFLHPYWSDATPAGQKAAGACNQANTCMRHHVQHCLDLDCTVPEKVSRELIGHEGKDVHTAVYGDAHRAVARTTDERPAAVTEAGSVIWPKYQP